METIDKHFEGSIPAIYDQMMVPLIFEPYARDLAGRLAAAGPRHILEIAAGTGALTRAMASRFPASTRIIATDLNPAMLAHAKTRQSADARIEWHQADALALPFGDQEFDAVACQFGAMFFPSKVAGYQEAYRVLKPGGHFLFSVWDRIADNEFADVATATLATMFPDNPPRFLERTPHGYYDAEQIRAELAAAGFTKVSIDPVEFQSKASSPTDPAIAYCHGTPLRNEIEVRDASRMDDAVQEVAAALADRFGRGPIEGRIRALVMTAIR